MKYVRDLVQTCNMKKFAALIDCLDIPHSEYPNDFFHLLTAYYFRFKGNSTKFISPLGSRMNYKGINTRYQLLAAADTSITRYKTQIPIPILLLTTQLPGLLILLAIIHGQVTWSARLAEPYERYFYHLWLRTAHIRVDR